MTREFDYDWVADEQIKSLTDEYNATRMPHRLHAEKIMTEALPICAQRLTHIAKYHPDPIIAMKAIDRVMDRTMGRPKISQDINFPTSPEQNLQEKMMAEIEAMLTNS